MQLDSVPKSRGITLKRAGRDRAEVFIEFQGKPNEKKKTKLLQK